MAVYNHFWPFFANCMFILHKPEVLTAFFRGLTVLNLNWFKTYVSKYKYFHFLFMGFVKKIICDICIFVFFFVLCVITTVPFKI